MTSTPTPSSNELRRRAQAQTNSNGQDEVGTPRLGSTSGGKEGTVSALTLDDGTGAKQVKAAEGKEDAKEDKERVVYGRTADGVVFPIPQTHDMLSSLFDPRLRKSHLDSLTLALLGLQILAWSFLPLRVSRYLFLAYFAVWRLAYNLGLGYVLRRQSMERWIVKGVKREGWMDKERRPAVTDWVKKQLEGKMGSDYRFEACPLDYNVWLFFRHVVDIILLNDFLSYFFFSISWMRLPEGHSFIMHVLRWTAGFILIVFNLWVKVDAHRIVKDFAWYWGDAFFLSLQELVFDGVFELAPHPMYSVGYAGYYGLSLIVGSQTVLFVSLAAHMCQFGFLVWFENPHIDRTYGQKKPLAARIPLSQQPQHTRPRATSSASPSPINGLKPLPTLSPSSPVSPSLSTAVPRATKKASADLPDLPAAKPLPGRSNGHLHRPSGPDAFLELENLSTPSATEGETESETEWDDDEPAHAHVLNLSSSREKPRSDSVTSVMTNESAVSTSSRHTNALAGRTGPRNSATAFVQQPPTTRHDLDNRYFRNDVIVFRHLDVFRATDFTFILLIAYAAGYNALPHSLPPRTWLGILILNAVFWRLFHTVGLGLALRAQSKSKWIVRHFVKHYHYEQPAGAIEEAFRNWKSIYNLSLTMTYVSFGTLAWRCYTTPESWFEGIQLTRHVMGLLLVALHVWTAQSTFETLGPFGWFYGDFFIQDYPTQLYYTGIYRFLNNPERSMGGAAFFGLAIFSGSKLVGAFALVSILAHWWFLSNVENPHMQRLYGAAIRKEAGVTKTLKNVASKNMHHISFLSGGAQSSSRQKELQRVAREVQGTFGKVMEETVEAVEEFLERSGPRLSDWAEGTKILLQQSRERLLIRRVASDLSPYDIKQYRIELAPSTYAAPITAPNGKTINRYHLGEPINITWRAPSNHSRKDWIGIYRLGANKSRFVTRVSSLGLWLPLHGVWDGDVYMGEKPGSSKSNETSQETGTLKFEANKLPWKQGKYEIRYHHDGKHNVMARIGQIEIFVDKPTDPDAFESIHSTLLRIVPPCLNNDPDLIPQSSQTFTSAGVNGDTHQTASAQDDTDPDMTVAAPAFRSDPDDFVMYDRTQAERVAYAIEQAFGVSFSTDVVVADANIEKLANRVLEGRRLLRPFGEDPETVEDPAHDEHNEDAKGALGAADVNAD